MDPLVEGFSLILYRLVASSKAANFRAVAVRFRYCCDWAVALHRGTLREIFVSGCSCQVTYGFWQKESVRSSSHDSQATLWLALYSHYFKMSVRL